MKYKIDYARRPCWHVLFFDTFISKVSYWTPFILYSVQNWLFTYCISSPVILSIFTPLLRYNKFYTWKRWNLSNCISFDYTRIKFNTCHTVPLWCYTCHILSRVIPCKFSSHKYSRWLVSYCTSVHWMRVPRVTCYTVQICIVQVLKLIVAVLYELLFYPSPLCHMPYWTKWYGIRVLMDTFRTVPISIVDLSMLTSVVPYKFLS